MRRTALLIPNGGDAAAENAQAAAEGLNVERLFGGERRQREGNIESVGMRGIK